MNRMHKKLMAGVATVLLTGTPAIAMVGIGTAGAAPAVASPVGKYTATIVSGPSSFTSPLTMNKIGTFRFTGGPHGTWTEATNVIHMTGTYKTGAYLFTVRQIGKNLGSVTKQGTITLNGSKFAKWYAVRG